MDLSELYRNKRPDEEEKLKAVIKGEIPCLVAEAFERTGKVEHCFTTRLGGCSTGIYESLNFSFVRGDDPQHVTENYRRIAQALQCKVEDLVATKQTHTTNIRIVTEADRGKGIVCPTDYDDVDGLVTDCKEITLAGFIADCVPILFLDPVKNVIGFAHSGWRGTAGKIGEKMVDLMREKFQCESSNIMAVIGPSICRDCYEVSEDVAMVFADLFKEDTVLTPGVAEGKYQLDLWKANAVILRQAGLPEENITVTDVCTCHNPKLMFSHRASKGQRGNLGAFIKLKKY